MCSIEILLSFTDFLPIKCGGCGQLFCGDHFRADVHECAGAISSNKVPQCPLCGVPVPVAPNESPDYKVGQHIDTACTSQPAAELKGKIFTNSCNFGNCRKRELVECICPKCNQNFCMRHRMEADHNCQGKLIRRSIPKSGTAAIMRAIFSRDQLMAKNLQEKEDRLMAERLSRQLNGGPSRSPTSPNSDSNNCAIQ
ncbi:zinc finger, AN1-type domain [Cichlidogyrus casuarinus]|uniref:Zinc finger, AN1-type domain n=1 Tax=Cichlidogyrus casuarinus TaxID=1844966 RepID=A0ABD2Q9I1_9PLAT